MTTSRCEERHRDQPWDEGAARLLTTPPPPVDLATAEAALREHYGLAAQASALHGERDANFMVALADGTRRVFKVFNDAEDAATRALQTGALFHLERVGVVCAVPRLVPTLGGATECAVAARGRTHRAILITAVPGEPLDRAEPGRALRRDLGRVAAAIGVGLAGYDHPAARRVLMWDPMQLGRLARVVDEVETPGRSRWLGGTLERFLAETRPAALRLPAQVIHNDMNGSNVLVAGEAVVGVIDFGDMVLAPRINEVAIAANYVVPPEGDVVAAVGDVMAGYDAARPLAEDEVALLHDLVLSRLALRVLMYRWRESVRPDERDDLRRRGAAADRLVDALAATPRDTARDALLRRWREERRHRAGR